MVNSNLRKTQFFVPVEKKVKTLSRPFHPPPPPKLETGGYPIFWAKGNTYTLMATLWIGEIYVIFIYNKCFVTLLKCSWRAPASLEFFLYNSAYLDSAKRASLFRNTPYFIMFFINRRLNIESSEKVLYKMFPEFVTRYEEFFGFSLLYLFHLKWIILFNDLKYQLCP